MGNDFWDAIKRIPPGFYVRIEMDFAVDEYGERPDGDPPDLTLTLWQAVPEGGWPDARHPCDHDRVLSGLCGEPEQQTRALVNEVNRRWP
jgi:hypothetical protein